MLWLLKHGGSAWLPLCHHRRCCLGGRAVPGGAVRIRRFVRPHFFFHIIQPPPASLPIRVWRLIDPPLDSLGGKQHPVRCPCACGTRGGETAEPLTCTQQTTRGFEDETESIRCHRRHRTGARDHDLVRCHLADVQIQGTAFDMMSYASSQVRILTSG